MADVPESAADPGGGQAAGRAGLLPGQLQVGDEVAGEAELGVAGDDQPGPPVGSGRGAELGAGPAENLFQEPEGVLEVEAQERLPGAVHRISGCGSGRGPRP